MTAITAPAYFTRKAAAFLTKAGAPDASPDQLAAWAQRWLTNENIDIAGCFVTASGRVLGDVMRAYCLALDGVWYASEQVTSEYGLPAQLVADRACAELSRVIGEPVIIARAWQLAKGV